MSEANQEDKTPQKFYNSTEVEDTSMDVMYNTTIEYGRDAIKTSLLINAGAAIAILAFMGNALGKEIPSEWKAAVSGLSLSLIGYTAGVLLAGFNYGIAHFSQGNYLRAQYNSKILLREQSNDPTREYNNFTKHLKKGNIWRSISIAVTVATFIAFALTSGYIYTILP